MRPFVLFRNDPVDTYGIARDALAGEGLPVVVLDAWEPSWPGPGEISGVVAFGGAMNVDETVRFPYLARERAFLRECVERGVPVLGICLGAQLLARALDAPVMPSPVREIGFTPIRPTTAGASDPLVSAFSDGSLVFHWHEDTFELPPGSDLLATGDDVLVQAFRAGPRAWGLQFHLEIDRDEIEAWLDDAGDDLEEAWGKSKEAVRREAELHLDRQSERARKAFKGFAYVVRETERAMA
ncbi:MAG: type 1 glutamine amidotransferase [Actinomycetota bacterium]|nr:type 1 glutamine amidotransferase [Actinomycetota bacterium]